MHLTHVDVAELENITRKSRALLALMCGLGVALFALTTIDAGRHVTSAVDATAKDIETGPLDAGILLVGLLTLAVGLISQIAFAFFAYRTNANARKVGIQSLLFTPFWAAALNFIPATQIVFPYLVIRETWGASRAFAQMPKAMLPLNLCGAAWALMFVPLAMFELLQAAALPLACAFMTFAALLLRRVMTDLAAVQLHAFPRQDS